MGRSGNRLVQFRQFQVSDAGSAMKIGTDGLILGAWPAISDAFSILDVGTGSGLVALMAAQRAPKAAVTGVELEPSAAEQARENFSAAPFASRLTLVEGDFIEWAKGEPGTFEVILCNPPYFRDKPKSPHPARNLARHDDTLSIEAIFESLRRITTASSQFHLVWPTDRIPDLIAAGAANGWYESARLAIHGTPALASERMVSTWQRVQPPKTVYEKIAIEVESFSPSGTPDRTDEFKRLMAPFMERYASFGK